ncbi:PREDICTED: dual specificity protein kinase shkE-like [Amphimedon queenslandica]|uniref:CAP-Gly domain-containing protein n=2 Tax=Amphimedon queenslandica TaxID=400682 RepID=A0AAN0JWE9_AMPQE|nr:PREDICTED: dual specificity protein kinase shkE-like [Amphimedon queenslandica]|eukprot:XP_019861498.1 PREDICTED: dual specificity protein kinase shkE-like [Amphimedon queenslandica]
MVRIDTVKGDPLYGVVKWIGPVPDYPGTIAGVEMEKPLRDCTDGTWRGIRFFTCPPGRGYFCPLNTLKQDTKYMDTTQSDAPPDFQSILTPDGTEIHISSVLEEDYPKDEHLLYADDNITEAMPPTSNIEWQEGLTTSKYINAQYSHDNLRKDHQQLQKSHDALTKNYQELQEINKRLRIALQKSQEENERLQEVNERLVQTQTELASKLNEVAKLQSSLQKLENNWKINRSEISLSRKELGRGGWGVIWMGEFRGQRVAVKQMHDVIKSEDNMDLLHREINTMSQLRHPNLLQFIGAVLDDDDDPLIITELMDTSLRKAYERKELTTDPGCRPVILSIMRDVAVGLNYTPLST